MRGRKGSGSAPLTLVLRRRGGGRSFLSLFSLLSLRPTLGLGMDCSTVPPVFAACAKEQIGLKKLHLSCIYRNEVM